MALLHHQRQDAEADERRQDRRDRRRQRDHDRPERHREHEEGDADDVEQEDRQSLHDPLGDVLERRGLAGDVRDRVAALGRDRHDVVPQTVDELARRLVLRRGRRGDEDDRNGLLVVELRLADGRHAWKPLHAVVDLLRHLLVAVHVDDDRDRAVEAGAESLRQEVVGAAGGLLLRLGPLVGRAEADERRGATRARGSRTSTTEEHDLRVRGHEAAPAGDRASSPAPPRSRRAGGGTAPSTGRSCARASPAPRSRASSRSPRS